MIMDEDQRVLSIPSWPPANRRRVARASATGSTVHFLSLSEKVFHKLFDYLSYTAGTTGYCSRDAVNLAATCQQLNHSYRCGYVVGIRLCIGPRRPSGVLFRALDRLPRVDNIELCELPLPMHIDSIEAFIRVLRKTASKNRRRPLQSRALGIKSLTLRTEDQPWACRSLGRDREVEISTECVRSAVGTFCRLQYLCMRSFIAVGDDAVTAIAEHLSDSLQNLALWDQATLSDTGGVHISKLHCLKSLEIRSCYSMPQRLTDITFDGLSALEELEFLKLTNCSISDASACRVLPDLRKLAVLDLRRCEYVTSAVFSFLPRSLVTLKIVGSISRRFGDVPQSALEGLPSLTSFTADWRAVNDISFVRPVATRLKVLDLSRIGASDANVAHWVRRMPNLEELALPYSGVSDETARAVSTLGKIRKARFDCTEISNDGVRALAKGIACQSLEYLDLGDCPNITLEDGAFDALSHAIPEIDDDDGRFFVTGYEGSLSSSSMSSE